MSGLPRPRPRPNIESMSPYRPVRRQMGRVSGERVVRLDANEAPVPVAGLASALAERLTELELNRYPSDDRKTIAREALGKIHGLEGRRVFLGNGSNEVLLACHVGFGGTGRRAALFVPTYTVYSKVAQLAGTEVLELDRTPTFEIPDEAVDTLAASAPHLVHVCSPNNPTGNASPLELVLELTEALPSALVVVDRAYAPFGAEESEAKLLERPNVVVVRTFSKAVGLAGLRVGYALVSEELCDAFEKLFLPYNFDAVSIEAVLLACEMADQIRRIEDALAEERDRLYAGIASLESLQAFPSSANFVLFGPKGAGATRSIGASTAEELNAKARGIFELLKTRSIYVRDCTSWPGLVGCLRVSAGTREETDEFLQALEEAVGR